LDSGPPPGAFGTKREGGRAADLLFVGATEVGGCGMFINGACGGIESFPLTNDSRRRFWFYSTQKFVFEVNWQSQFVDIYVRFLFGMCCQIVTLNGFRLYDNLTKTRRSLFCV
jgi:hypothetical protein